jgi:hypothetical protein
MAMSDWLRSSPKTDFSTPSPPRRINWKVLVGVIAVALLAMFLYNRYRGVDYSAPLPGDASLNWTDVLSTVRNESNEPWENVRLELNPGQYTLRVKHIEAGGSYTASTVAFSNSKGERFNPTTHKGQRFTVRTFSDPWPRESGTQRTANWTL